MCLAAVAHPPMDCRLDVILLARCRSKQRDVVHVFGSCIASIFLLLVAITGTVALDGLFGFVLAIVVMIGATYMG